MRRILTNDTILKNIMIKEFNRQKNGIELIASENFTSQNVLDCLGSVFTNKYSDGLPGKRYYGGNQFIDELESLGIVSGYSGSKAREVLVDESYLKNIFNE